MTLQDLKNNREAIIANITELVGEDKVEKVMRTMVNGLDCCDSIEELMMSAIEICDFEANAKPDSKLVRMHNAAHIDEKFNYMTKTWEKI